MIKYIKAIKAINPKAEFTFNDVDNITFTNPLLTHDTIRVRTKEYNQFNSHTWRLPVSVGKLILFPSNVPHHVDSPIGDKDRITLSFNVFPFGILGDRDQLGELRILQDKYK